MISANLRHAKGNREQNKMILLGCASLLLQIPTEQQLLEGLAASACAKTVCNTLAVAEGFKVLAGGSSPGKTLAIVSAAAAYL